MLLLEWPAACAADPGALQPASEGTERGHWEDGVVGGGAKGGSGGLRVQGGWPGLSMVGLPRGQPGAHNPPDLWMDG